MSREHIAGLPVGARDKLRGLEMQRDASLDAAGAAAARLNRLPGDVDPQLVSRWEAERAGQAARHAALHQVGSRVVQWLAQLPAGVVLESTAAPPVELRPGEKWADAIAAVRSEIAALRGKLARVKSAPLTQDEQDGLIEAYVARLMQQARPSVAIVGDQLRVTYRGDIHAPEDVAALLAWAAPGALANALDRELAKLPARNNGAMSKPDRVRQEAEIAEQILDAEQLEESLIERAAAEGIEVLRRPDADPRAVLGVAIAQAQPAQAVA